MSGLRKAGRTLSSGRHSPTILHSRMPETPMGNTFDRITELPAEVAARCAREKEFFDRHSNTAEVPDEALRVPAQLSAIPEEIRTCFPRLEGTCVCEVGCGYGVISAWFAQQGATVYAFDVSEANIRIAERAAQVNRVSDRIHLSVMPGECLSYADNLFDLIFGNAVLHHLDLAISAREFYRVLRPGGVAIFREPLGENRLLEWARRCPWRSEKHRHSPDERPLRYSDVDTLRTVFPKVDLREAELLAVLRAVVRKAEMGMIAIPRWERAMQRLERMDRWLLRHVPLIRPLASYSVLCLHKPAEETALAKAAAFCEIPR
jgi:SAM-dependent methyltransferase